MDIKTYVSIEYHEDYVYCPESHAIYRKGQEHVCCIFDLYTLFTVDMKTVPDLKTQIAIASRILSAYKLGIQDAHSAIRCKFNDLFLQ